jgi:hypothetical protein
MIRRTGHVVGIEELLSSRSDQLLGSKDTFCEAVAMIQLAPEQVKGGPKLDVYSFVRAEEFLTNYGVMSNKFSTFCG